MSAFAWYSLMWKAIQHRYVYSAQPPPARVGDDTAFLVRPGQYDPMRNGRRWPTMAHTSIRANE